MLHVVQVHVAPVIQDTGEVPAQALSDYLSHCRVEHLQPGWGMCQVHHGVFYLRKMLGGPSTLSLPTLSSSLPTRAMVCLGVEPGEKEPRGLVSDVRSLV